MKTFRTLLGLTGLLFALTASAAEATVRASLLASFDSATSKILQLAEAIPEDKYGWQPMEGVNTVREVLVHVTEANLGLGSFLGGTPPAGLDRKTADGLMQTKAAAIAVTKQGIDYMRGLLVALPADQFAKEVKFYGGPAPLLRVAMVTADHAHEHLGQLIAYARSNHVTPPWSK